MKRNILITGGAGFIGINTAEFYLRKGDNICILDNFFRKGTKQNILYLTRQYKKNLQIIKADVRYDQAILDKLVKEMDIIFHLAGQVAVTTSVLDPRSDFEINALGTLNLLEAIRKYGKDPIILYSSTNKVYGDLSNMAIKEKETCYEFMENIPGVSENFLLDFYSPYGCSKGTADQYMHDYHRIYGLRTIVFRQSCIYGPHQFGIEDQGWLAWFLIRLLKNEKITIYGNGKQVRDILYIDDLLNAYDLAIKNINVTKGQIYNIGGGIKNAMSVWWQLKDILEKITKKNIIVDFADWRPGDQKIYISDIRKAEKDFGWKPMIGINEGIQSLYTWLEKELA